MRKEQMLLLGLVFLIFKVQAQDTVYLAKSGSRPYLTVFKPNGQKTNTAVMICSGGSYGRTADEEEGIPAAKLLAQNGITAFLLDYRLPVGNDTIPLTDGKAGIQYIRAHSQQYGIDKDKVGAIGFSAGGHLISTLETHFDPANRPDFVVLVYPVISMKDELTHQRSRANLLGNNITPEKIGKYSNELQVAPDTPPTFIVAAIDDNQVKVANSLLFEAALQQNKVPVAMFLYATGGHGFGIHNDQAQVQWTDTAIDWIKTEKWKEK